MPTQWQDRYTALSNINNGYEFENGDDILAEHVNVAIENAAYAKKVADYAYAHTLQKVEDEFSYNPSSQSSVSAFINLVWQHPDIRLWINYGTLSQMYRSQVFVNFFLTGSGQANVYYLNENGTLTKITSQTNIEYSYFEIPANS